jgi:hypothetical protein
MVVRSDTSSPERCSWCGVAVEPGDGFRAAEHPGERTAVFCRLEHVVPWAMRGTHWRAATPGTAEKPNVCSQCDEPLGDAYVQLVRHRGAHRIADAFCGVGHMEAWAKGGGRWLRR